MQIVCGDVFGLVSVRMEINTAVADSVMSALYCAGSVRSLVGLH